MTATLELPTGRAEDWRYTPVDEIRRRADGLTPRRTDVDLAAVDHLVRWHGGVQVLLLDGVHAPDGSRPRLPPGLALDVDAAGGVVRLAVDDDVTIDDAVHVLHVSTGTNLVQPRLVVDVGARSGLHLVETHVSAAGDGLTDASTTVHLAARSRLLLHRAQDEAAGAFHVARLHVTQREGSRSDLRLLSHGAAVSRLGTIVDLLEPTASCRATGLLAPRPGARHDDVVTVDHVASRCTSDLTARTVVPAGARTSSSGHVIVRPGTVGSDVHQRADSLLLDRTAQADNRPWLEIFADDVRANHGSATGRLDEDALFYLRSRGIPLEEARRVLVAAFAREIVEQVQPASLRARVEEWFGWEDEG